MLKRDITDELYSIAIRRFKNEKPNIEMTTDIMDRIWCSIHGILNESGENKARNYVETAKLLEL